MTKNTAYYKAAFAKSEAASPYAKMNPHMKKDKTHMMAHHGDTSMKMGDKSHMAKHPGHMKMAGESHMKGKIKGEGTHEDHHKDRAKRVPGKKPGSYIGPGDFFMKTPGDTD